MKLTLAELADILEGSVVGDRNATIHNLSKIEDASSGDVTFISNPKYFPWIYKTNATAVIIDKGTAYNGNLKCNLIEVDNSYSAFNSLLKRFSSEKASHFGIMDNAIIDSTSKLVKNISVGHFSVIAENCKLGDNVIIMDNVSIAKNVTIGNNCLIHSGVRIYSDTIIGNNCIVHSNSVIGSDGFGYAPNKEGEYVKTPQIGNVIIGDNVEIGSNSSIDRATLGSTVISEGVKIDNLVQIAHNVTVGKNTVIAGQCGIAGSTKIGENCQIGGQVGIIGHLTIGNNVKINGKTGVFSNIKDNAILKGTPAIDERTFNRSYVYFRNLEKIVKDVNQLKKNDAGNN